jgi:hypothetical protein
VGIKMRDHFGRIVYRTLSINCKDYQAKISEDGVVERLRCVATTIKPECQNCSLINPVRPQRQDGDGGV